MPDLKLAYCDWNTAKEGVRRWYYRNEMPMGKYVTVGVWEDDRFCGVIMFGMGASDALGTRWGLKTREVCEMTRMALGPHETPTSRVLAIALRLLRKACPGLKAVVSFSDPGAGHVGTIYQAQGWIYCGTTASDKQYRDAAGEVHHSRSVDRSGFKLRYGKKTPCPRPQDCKMIRLEGKHRYVLPLTPEIRSAIVTTEVVKPKRAGSKENVATDHQSEEGGVIPTPALHSKTKGTKSCASARPR